jgi:hypothetical protein
MVPIRKVGSVVVVVQAACACAVSMSACGQGANQSSGTLRSSTEVVLQTLIGCQTDQQTCVAAATSISDVTQCDQQLRSCLTSLLPEGGVGGPPFPQLPGAFDAAPPPFTPPSFPSINLPTFPQLPPLLFGDGGVVLQRIPFPDAGLQLPPPPFFPDAGFPTPPPLVLPDAGLSATTPPGGLPPQLACQVDLQSCLFSQTAPMTCADNARTCLTAAAQAQCDAQEQACVAAGVSQAVCTAQRQACSP